MRKEAWTLAIETLSWMEMQKLSERLALARTTKQLGIKDVDAVRFAYTLVCETTKRRNFIDKFINKVLRATTIEELDLGVQAFLRLYVYQSRIAHDWANPNIKEAATIVKMGRSILGWKAFQRIEFALGNLLTQKPNVVYEDASDAETVGLKTFHPTWFVKYCFRTFGRAETLALLEANNKPLPTYIRLNTLKADEKRILEAL
ncbi:MAG: transcription antitermination factor NusB, partial [Candidatus Bathyarchaeia archaeon]